MKILYGITSILLLVSSLTLAIPLPTEIAKDALGTTGSEIENSGKQIDTLPAKIHVQDLSSDTQEETKEDIKVSKVEIKEEEIIVDTTEENKDETTVENNTTSEQAITTEVSTSVKINSESTEIPAVSIVPAKKDEGKKSEGKKTTVVKKETTIKMEATTAAIIPSTSSPSVTNEKLSAVKKPNKHNSKESNEKSDNDQSKESEESNENDTK